MNKYQKYLDVLQKYENSASQEFSKYQEKAHIVKSMVVDDSVFFMKRLYESLSEIVRFEDDLWKALYLMKDASKQIIATKVILVNQSHKQKCSCNTKYIVCDHDDDNKYSSHIVTLFKNSQHGQIYMFDPNGKCDKQINDWLYRKNKYLLDSQDLEGMYPKLTLPKYPGIQFHADPPNNGYINDAGYCIFYNFLAIKKILELPNGNIYTRIKQLTDSPEPITIFPADDKIGKVSKKIVDHVFA